MFYLHLNLLNKCQTSSWWYAISNLVMQTLLHDLLSSLRATNFPGMLFAQFALSCILAFPCRIWSCIWFIINKLAVIDHLIIALLLWKLFYLLMNVLNTFSDAFFHTHGFSIKAISHSNLLKCFSYFFFVITAMIMLCFRYCLCLKLIFELIHWIFCFVVLWFAIPTCFTESFKDFSSFCCCW